jgi:putative DNA primase/helicase
MLAGARETPGFFVEDRHKPDWWPNNPASVVTCRNGLLNMDTGDFLPATQDYFSIAHNDVVWTGIDTPAPRFNAWLKEVQPEAERRQQTEWLLGYTLYGDNPLSKLFYVYGGRRTGKGSTIRFMERLVGVKNSSVVCLKELGSDFGLESMIGKSLVTYPDYRAGDNGGGADLGQATQALLSLTGRDRLNIRRKNKTTIAVKLQAKFVMGSNTVIHLPDTAGVIATRFHGVGFKVTFADREIPDLDTHIWNEESSGILAAAVGYYRDFVANGFKFPDTEDSREMRDSVARSSSPMIIFVADCLAEGDADDWLSLKDAFAAFIEHLRAVNARTAGWTENKFRCSLKEQGIRIPKLQTASGRIEFVAGRVLTPAGQDALERADRNARHKENQQELTALTLEDKRRGSNSQWK